MAITKTKRRDTQVRPRDVELDIIYRPLAGLRPYTGNAKLHSRKQIAALARSIASSGFINPILIDEQDEILAGHGRYEAAELAGLTEVPTIRVAHLSAAQKKAYRIADNRLAEAGTSWSLDKLKVEVESILDLDAGFDLELTGFELRDLELKLDATVAAEPDEQDNVPDAASEAVSRVGDLWRIGEHRLLCADARDEASYRQLLGTDRASMVFADPPYNVPIQGHVSGKGKARHREFVQASGEMSDAEFQRFLLDFMLLCARFGKAGALHYICMDWAHLRHLLLAGAAAYDEQINLCVWSKSNAGMGSLYRSQHELVAVFKKGKAPHQNRVELGANGRNRSNVWAYAGMNSFSRERDALLGCHPTVKPLALVRDAILDATARGDIVLDPFGGSGTTLIAAAKVGRVARLLELDPLYCDVVLRRATDTLRIMPTLASGETFEAVARQRAGGRKRDR